MRTRILCMAMLCFLTTLTHLYSQTNLSDHTQSISASTAPAEMGTFHFISQQKSGIEVFTMEKMDALRVQIETMRGQSERVYWNYSDFTTVVIYSRDEIIHPSFNFSGELYQ